MVKVIKWQITFEEFRITSEAGEYDGSILWNVSEEAGNGRDCPVVPHVFVQAYMLIVPSS